MPELLRLFAARGPTALTVSQVQSFGIQSHPEGRQSAIYLRWLDLCKSGSTNALISDMTNFLDGGNSVKKLEDLGDTWSPIVARLLALEDRLTPERVDEIFQRTKAEPRDRESSFHKAFTGVADTLLALSRLKVLGRPGNLDYQTVLKLLSLAAWLDGCDKASRGLHPQKFLQKRVILPPEFRAGYSQGEQPSDRAGLLLSPQRAAERLREHVSGCISENCTCKENLACIEQSKCCATVRLFLIDLMLVKDETRRFQPGDISYIKNILLGEKLETVHRSLDRTVETMETEETVTTSEESYLEVNDTSRLQNEIESVIKDDTKFDAGVTANAQWGTEATAKYSVTATAGFSTQQQKEVTRKEVKDLSRNVIQRSTKKIESTVRRHLTITRTSETEETNTHGFSNENGATHVNGQYLFVDRVARAQMYSYGIKTVVEFALPEPAALYNHIWTTEFPGKAPDRPEDLTLTLQSITPENYQDVAAQHGVENAPEPPPFHTTVVKEFKGAPGDPKGDKKGSGSYIQSESITIPPNYVATGMSAQIIQLNYNSKMGVSCSVTVGGASVYDNHKDGTQVLSATLPGVTGTQPAVVHAWDVTDYDWIVTVNCSLAPQAQQAWQKSVFDLIESKYKETLEAYNKANAEYLAAKDKFEEEEIEKRYQRNGRNPRLNREIEATELKRAAISYLTCQFFDTFDAMKGKVKPCGHPQFSICEAEEQGRFVRFIEQAFSWKLMTYLFYPYFWGRKCTWKDKMRDESGDFVFNKFLTAGNARVLVPIRDGFVDMVQWFLDTGEIWGRDGTLPIFQDPHYVSIAQEMKEQTGNYYSDREGTLDVTSGTNVVTLTKSAHYWDFNIGAVDTLSVKADIDREIMIDCKIYRIVDIVENGSVPAHTSWTITLERNYEGNSAQNLMWSTGAVYVGAPWEYAVPTNLVFLRPPSKCLPVYPLPECKE
jgi:hypothetical protein